MAGKRGQYVVRVISDRFHEAENCHTYRVVWDTGDESVERDDCMLDRELIDEYHA